MGNNLQDMGTFQKAWEEHTKMRNHFNKLVATLRFGDWIIVSNRGQVKVCKIIEVCARFPSERTTYTVINLEAVRPRPFTVFINEVIEYDIPNTGNPKLIRSLYG